MADWWTIWENSLNPGEASTKSSHILITRIPNCTSYHTGYLIKPKRTRQPIFQYKNPMSYHTVPKHTSMLVHIMTPHHTNNVPNYTKPYQSATLRLATLRQSQELTGCSSDHQTNPSPASPPPENVQPVGAGRPSLQYMETTLDSQTQNVVRSFDQGVPWLWL